MTTDTRAAESAPVLEVFASVQGEGAYVGEPQVFLRLAGCPLRCRWCDTPGSWTVGDEPRARIAARTDELDREVRREPGVATPFQAACWIASAEGPGEKRTISVTGGEPLLYPEFVLELRTLVGDRRIHLETAGAHPAALERVRDAVDHISLDLKLPSTLDAPVELEAQPTEPVPTDDMGWRTVRGACLDLVRGRDACGKIVLAGGVDPREVADVLDDVERLAPDLPVYLQPATPIGGASAPSREEIEAAVELALERELSVRVVPQVHRALGVE